MTGNETVLCLGMLALGIYCWKIRRMLRDQKARIAQQQAEFERVMQEVENHIRQNNLHAESIQAAYEELRRSQERFEVCVQGSRDGIWDWDVRTNEIYFSRQWKAMLGYEDHEIPNHLDEWTKRLHPEDRDRAVDSAQAYLMGLLPAYEISFRMLHRDGSYRWILARGAALYNADGRPYRMAGSHTDITDRMEYEAQLETQMLQLNEAHVQLEIEQAKLRELNAHLEKLATTDGLTGLKNHRAFQEHLEQEIERARRYNYSLSLALLDVDKFKAYNDTFGHPAGDQVLKQVGATLLKTARKSDLPARYGGEEFAVILPHTDKAGALRFAERLRKAIEKIKDPNRAISASLGVATLTPVMADRAELIAQADAALYASKKAGRNRVTHYTALHEMQEEVREVKEECRVG